MNLNNIINQLAETTPETMEQKSDRRNVLKSLGGKLAAAAIPFAAATFTSNTAKAQSKESIIKSLNYLLRLEYLCDKFYADIMAPGEKPLMPTDVFKTQLEMVAKQTKSHINKLQEIIQTIGGTVETLSVDKMDLTGGSGENNGTFLNYNTDLHVFTTLMCVFTDGGTRIYKGQLTEVLSDKETLRVLSSIHSVKARQAALARYIRQYWSGKELKPWITNNLSESTNNGAQRAYAGENVLEQGGVSIVGINGFNIDDKAASQAFDEPLDMVLGDALLNKFINRR